MSAIPATLYRTDHLPHHMNAGKEAQVRMLQAAWRRAAPMRVEAPGSEEPARQEAYASRRRRVPLHHASFAIA